MPMSDETASPIEMLQVEHLNDANASSNSSNESRSQQTSKHLWYRFSAVTGELTKINGYIGSE